MALKNHIADSITSMNLLSGTLGVIFTFNDRLDIAFLLMLAAAVFDFFDGMVARMLNAHSNIGKDLDSLSDMVSFGVLPAMMLYKLMCNMVGDNSLWCYIPLVIAIFSGLRLAKFNVDTRQKTNFIGLATPASAMICGSLAYFVSASSNSFLTQWCQSCWFIPALAIILSALMVSEIPMFSLKIKKDGDSITKMKRIAFLTIAVLCLVVVIVASLNWSMTVLLTLTFYILMNIVFLFVPSKK
jgi:CDP-diacylglycerol--serine O-phosphatidyltransferase